MTTPAAKEEPALLIPQVPDAAAALRKVEATQAELATAGDVEVEADVDPRAREEYEFEVSLVDGAGKKWQGSFRNRVLSIDERLRVGLLQAQFTNHVPWSSLDDETTSLAEMVAHLTLSLQEKPTWFVVSGDKGMRNVRLISAVYSEVAAHEATFRGPAEGVA